MLLFFKSKQEEKDAFLRQMVICCAHYVKYTSMIVFLAKFAVSKFEHVLILVFKGTYLELYIEVN